MFGSGSGFPGLNGEGERKENGLPNVGLEGLEKLICPKQTRIFNVITKHIVKIKDFILNLFL